jgi:hypothetical protein
MRKYFFLAFILLSINKGSYSQVTPNMVNAVTLSPTSEKASKMTEEPVNLFTGVPQIGVPLYSYKSAANGLSLDISLNYFAGGVQVSEAPTTTGLGWYLNAGGIITRTVRGIADEKATGFMNLDTIPNDFRSKADGYYKDSLDAEQDMFQYNFNGRSGAFYIGKNGQIAQMPISKMKIIPRISGNTIYSFTIKTENGNSYVFGSAESTASTEYGGYSLPGYNSAWVLTQIISAFNTDTISLNYTQKTITTDFDYPPLTYVRNSDGSTSNKLISLGGNAISQTKKISSIVFPDNTVVSFIYGPDIYYSEDNALSLVKIGDTAFRYGYILNYQSTDSAGKPTRLLLKSVTPYTATQKSRGYSFTYNTPTLAPLGSAGDTIQNKRDFWGFYNGVLTNTTSVPNVNGYTWGADRKPYINYARAGSLKNFYLPQGGYINYEYELNAHYPYTKVYNAINFDATASHSYSVNFNQVFNTSHQIVFTLDSSLSRQGAPPFSGNGLVTINVKNTAGTITYATYTLSLYNLFYKGMLAFSFNVPNGNYSITQSTAIGTLLPQLIVKMSWENKVVDLSKTSVESGGLRIKKITRMTGPDDPAASVTEYKYVNTDGTSSGFLGDVAQYYYPYRETVNYGGVTTTNYTAVTGDPWLNNMSAGIAGYSRVEVYHGTTGRNSGKTVYEFTTPHDAGTLYTTAIFPYAPVNLKSWGLGLTKKVSIYDSTGTIVKKITNSYGIDTTISYNNKNFRSLKLGISYSYINGDPHNPTSETYTYSGQEYYPPSGREYLASSTDTLFQTDGSKNISYTNYTYDTNYNVTKIVSPYSKTRGLQLERRFYYPYNYTVGDGTGLLRDSSIISPVIATEDWITGDATPRIISGTITYYHQISGNYVEPLTVYSLQANHPIAESVIGAFSASSLNRNSTYFVAQEGRSNYDSRGNLLSSKNLISGISNSVIMDYNQNYPVAKVSNASYPDIAYTSFEADGSGNWTIESTSRYLTDAVTGIKSYNLTNGNISKSNLTSSKTYLVSVWSKTGGTVKVNGVSQTNILATQNGWNFYSTTVSGVSSVIITGSGLIDELRLYPRDANMITYTYKPLIGITSTTDDNNTIVYNEYDALNRLKIVRDKDKNIIKRFDYSDTAISINIEPTWTFTNTECGSSDGEKDSVFIDTNLYSSTYNTYKYVDYATDYCTCGTSGQHPDYKVVNGTCEQALKCTTSSSYVKVINPDDTYYFTWKCTWHYKWSDGSVSPNYFDYHSSSCPLGCFHTLEL